MNERLYHDFPELGIAGCGNVSVRRNSLKRLKRFVENRSVLDVGCNVGALSFHAEDLGASRVLGIDKDKTAIDTAITIKRRFAEELDRVYACEFRCTDFFRFAQEESLWETVLLYQVIGHTEEKLEMLRALKKICEIAVIYTPVSGLSGSLVEYVLNKGGGWDMLPTSDWMNKILRQTGFSVIYREKYTWVVSDS